MFHAVATRRCIAAFAALLVLGAQAQDYPTKAIKLVVPFPPSGGTDILARVVAQKVMENTKWTVIIENRAGAGGNIGVDVAAKSRPDGYTLVMGQTSNLAINPSLYKSIPYDPLKDLVPVVMVGSGPIAIAVRNASPLKSLADLIAAGRAKPGAITMASPGNGTVAHLSGVRLMQATGARFEHIPYKGASAALPDLMGGNVDFYVSSVPSVQAQVSSGTLRALATTGAKRSSTLPNVPTVGETLKGFQAETWFGILAPAGTPSSIVARLNAEFNRALQDPTVRKTIESEGGEALGGTPEAFAATMRSEIVAWEKVVKDSGAKVD